jgi:hypothetical protein
MAFSALWLSETAIEENIAVVAAQERYRLMLLAVAARTSCAHHVHDLLVVGVDGRPQATRASFWRADPLSRLLTVDVRSLRGLTSLDLVHGLPRLALWSFLSVYTPYIWFLAYALVDQRARDRSPDTFQLGTFHPFWGGPSSIPFGKGAGFLRKTLSKTPADLAVTQIKGVKLLLWSNLLLGLKMVLTWLCEEQLNIPSVELAVGAYLEGQGFPVADWLVGTALVYRQVLFADRVLGTSLYRWRTACRLPLATRHMAATRSTDLDRVLQSLLLLLQGVAGRLLLRADLSSGCFASIPRLRMFFRDLHGRRRRQCHFSLRPRSRPGRGDGCSRRRSTRSPATRSTASFWRQVSESLRCVRTRVTAPRPRSPGRLWSFLYRSGVLSFACTSSATNHARHTLLERSSFLASLFGVG